MAFVVTQLYRDQLLHAQMSQTLRSAGILLKIADVVEKTLHSKPTNWFTHTAWYWIFCFGHDACERVSKLLNYSLAQPTFVRPISKIGNLHGEFILLNNLHCSHAIDFPLWHAFGSCNSGRITSNHREPYTMAHVSFEWSVGVLRRVFQLTGQNIFLKNLHRTPGFYAIAIFWLITVIFQTLIVIDYEHSSIAIRYICAAVGTGSAMVLYIISHIQYLTWFLSVLSQGPFETPVPLRIAAHGRHHWFNRHRSSSKCPATQWIPPDLPEIHSHHRAYHQGYPCSHGVHARCRWIARLLRCYHFQQAPTIHVLLFPIRLCIQWRNVCGCHVVQYCDCSDAVHITDAQRYSSAYGLCEHTDAIGHYTTTNGCLFAKTTQVSWATWDALHTIYR